jgi:hypothetical protein
VKCRTAMQVLFIYYNLCPSVKLESLMFIYIHTFSYYKLTNEQQMLQTISFLVLYIISLWFGLSNKYVAICVAMMKFFELTTL